MFCGLRGLGQRGSENPILFFSRVVEVFFFFYWVFTGFTGRGVSKS